MSLKKTILTAALATPLMLIGSWASAEDKHDHDHDKEHRQHGSHVHGIAALNLALEGNEVHIELDSPAANIVGFEHAPSSAEEHKALDNAVATLKEGDKLFKFNDQAGCQMEMAKVDSDLLEEGHAGEKPDAHADDKKEEHEHDTHDAEHTKKDEHEHEEKEGHDEHDEEHGHEDQHQDEDETHSDMNAIYHFECEAPAKLTQLGVELFEAFSGMQEIKVQYVIESKQGAAELTAKDQVIKF